MTFAMRQPAVDELAREARVARSARDRRAAGRRSVAAGTVAVSSNGRSRTDHAGAARHAGQSPSCMPLTTGGPSWALVLQLVRTDDRVVAEFRSSAAIVLSRSRSRSGCTRSFDRGHRRRARACERLRGDAGAGLSRAAGQRRQLTRLQAATVCRRGEAPDVRRQARPARRLVRASTRGSPIVHFRGSGRDVVGLPRVIHTASLARARRPGTCAGGLTRWVRWTRSPRWRWLGADQPAWTSPRVGARCRRAAGATALGHPLLPDDRRVANDVEVGPRRTLLLITGSNMSGKSTLLRAIGLNTVLAQAGAPVCAAAFEMPPGESPHEHPRGRLARARPLVFHGGARAVETDCQCRPSTGLRAGRPRALLSARRSAPGNQQRRARDCRPRGGAPPPRRAGPSA